MYTLQTYDIDDIWGGEMTFDAKYLSRFTAAIASFTANNSDPRAAVIPNYYFVQVNKTNFLEDFSWNTIDFPGYNKGSQY